MIKEYTLGDCVEMIIDYRGKTPQKMGGDWVDNGYRVISALNVHGGFIDNEDQIRCVSQEIYEKWMKDEIKRNDCFLASEGASLGENTIWDSDEKIVLGQRLYAIRTNQDKLDPWYFAMYMQTKKFRQQIDQISTGSTVFGISQPVLLGVKLLLPNIVEQRKIGALYRNIYHKLKNNNSICSDLESMAKLLYDYWFVQFDFPDENGRPYKSSGGKMVWNDEVKREIPEGWGILDLNEHLKTIRGISYSTPDLNDNGVPMINLACFSVNSNYNHAGLKRFGGNYSNDKVLKPYELVMCNTQQTALDPTKDIIGKCLIVPDIFDGDILSSHHVNRLLFDDEDLKFYFYGESKTVWFHKFVSGLCSGTNILGMDFNGLYRYKMTMPPVHLLKQYSKMVVEIETKKSNIIEENQELTSLRDFLLPMLMNGQIKIKDAKAS